MENVTIDIWLVIRQDSVPMFFLIKNRGNSTGVKTDAHSRLK